MSGNLWQLFAVAGGGALGALGRYGLTLWFAQAFPAKFNLATLMANIVGSLLMGVGYVLIVERALLPGAFRYLLMVGLLGAFTTFSTFSLEALQLLQSGQWVGAIGYVLASVLLSLVAVFAGYFLTQLLVQMLG
jgi:CrcB protein